MPEFNGDELPGLGPQERCPVHDPRYKRAGTFMGERVETAEVAEPPIFKLLSQERRALSETDRELGSPEQIPDLMRELVMVDGALQSVEKRAAELVARLEPVLTDPDSVLKAASAQRAERGADMAPQSYLARRAAGFQERLGALEVLLEVVTNRLGV